MRNDIVGAGIALLGKPMKKEACAGLRRLLPFSVRFPGLYSLSEEYMQKEASTAHALRQLKALNKLRDLVRSGKQLTDAQSKSLAGLSKKDLKENLLNIISHKTDKSNYRLVGLKIDSDKSDVAEKFDKLYGIRGLAEQRLNDWSTMTFTHKSQRIPSILRWGLLKRIYEHLHRQKANNLMAEQDKLKEFGKDFAKIRKTIPRELWPSNDEVKEARRYAEEIRRRYGIHSQVPNTHNSLFKRREPAASGIYNPANHKVIFYPEIEFNRSLSKNNTAWHEIVGHGMDPRMAPRRRPSRAEEESFATIVGSLGTFRPGQASNMSNQAKQNLSRHWYESYPQSPDLGAPPLPKGYNFPSTNDIYEEAIKVYNQIYPNKPFPIKPALPPEPAPPQVNPLALVEKWRKFLDGN